MKGDPFDTERSGDRHTKAGGGGGGKKREPRRSGNAYETIKNVRPVESVHKSTLSRKQSFSLPRDLGSLKRSPLRENLNQIHISSHTESDSATSLSDTEAYPQGSNKENRLMGNYVQ